MAIPVALIIEAFIEISRASKGVAETIEANRQARLSDEAAAEQIRGAIARARAFRYEPVTPAVVLPIAETDG